jgi:hypothetical protein
MTGAWEFFNNFIESESYVHVKLGMGTKNALNGSRTVLFRIESGGVLRVMDMLWVPKCRRSVLFDSTIGKKGFNVSF